MGSLQMPAHHASSNDSISAWEAEPGPVAAPLGGCPCFFTLPQEEPQAAVPLWGWAALELPAAWPASPGSMTSM